MILNGFALRDFNKWLFDNQNLYAYNVLGNEIITNALIIFWLDSVGIYVFVDTQWSGINTQWWRYHMSQHYWDSNLTETNFKSRQAATEKAIEKAIEIYNSKQQ